MVATLDATTGAPAAPRSLAELSDAERRLMASPYGFGRYILDLPFSDQPAERRIGACRNPETQEEFYPIYENDRQRQVVDALDAEGAKVSVRTCNGAGKTTLLIPTAVLWFMALHPRAKVVMTSGVERQVRGQLFPALKAHARRLGGWKFNDADIEAPNGSIAIGFSTNDGGRFEGWHGNKDALYDLFKNDGPLMIVVDEAKSVAPTIFDAIDRCTYQRLLYASSCGGSTGEFYKSHTSAARFFQTFQIASAHCPHADHDKNRDLILKRGILDPLVRSKVFAEFMEGSEGAVVKTLHLNASLLSPPARMRGTRRVFCDFAAGGDENVIAEREGNVCRIVAAWREGDTTRLYGQFIDHFRKLGINPGNCSQIVAGDVGGIGKLIIQRFGELGWHIQPVNNGAASRQSHYANRAAEIWYEGAKGIEQKRYVFENLDDLTIAQLTERTGYTDSKGRLHVEPKEDMKARGLDSPDRADALLGAMEETAALAPVQFAHRGDQDLSLLERIMAERNETQEHAGSFTG